MKIGKFLKALLRPRYCCDECGTKNSWRGHIIHAWWMATYKPSPHHGYFEKALLKDAAHCLGDYSELFKAKPFPAQAGASSIHFGRPTGKQGPRLRKPKTRKPRTRVPTLPELQYTADRIVKQVQSRKSKQPRRKTKTRKTS